MQDVVKSKKTENKKRRRRKRNLSIYYVLLLIVAAIVLLVLSRTVLFNAEAINIYGASRYTPNDILNAANLSLGDNLFKQSPKEIEQAIIKNLVYVDSAEVTRRLPSTIEIAVTEAKQYACCQDINGQYAVISKSGKFLEVGLASPIEGIIQVKGSELTNAEIGGEFTTADPEKTDILFKLFSAIDENCPNRVTQIDLTNRVDIVIELGQGLTAEIGSFKDYDYKIKYVSAILEKLAPDAKGKIIYHSTSAGVTYISQEDLDEYYAELERREQMNAVTNAPVTEQPE